MSNQQNNNQGGFRTAKTDPFKPLYEKGQDHLKPYIEEKDDKGVTQRRVPKGAVLSLFDLTDEQIGDYLSPQELKKMREIQKTRQPNRDLCKEYHDKKQKDEDDKNAIIAEQAKKISELQSILIQHNTLLSQIVDKIKNI